MARLDLVTTILPGLSGVAGAAADRQVLRFRVNIDAVPDTQWDESLAGFSDCSLEQSAAYSRRRWGSGHDSHLVLRDGERPVAMARVATFQAPVVGRGIAFVKFGPVWRSRTGDADVAVYRRMLAELGAEYCGRRGMLLTIQPRPNPTIQPIEEAALGDHGFVLRRPMASPDRFFVDLGLSAEEQRGSLGQKWRYNLKKAESAGVTVDLVEGGTGFEAFARMHREMVARKNAAESDPVGLLPWLHDRLPPELRPAVVIARHDGEPVAGAIVGTFGDTAYYLYGASREGALKVNAGFALHWWIVGWLSAGGARWYDLGGAPESSMLRQFKSGLTGRRGQVLPQLGERDFWARADQRIVADMLFRLRESAQALRRKTGL
ncbi:MAG: GNAT family N-acetyltransferase [Bauldia sp.]